MYNDTRHDDAQHNNKNTTLELTKLGAEHHQAECWDLVHYAERHNDEYHYGEQLNAECHNDECHYAECHYTKG